MAHSDMATDKEAGTEGDASPIFDRNTELNIYERVNAVMAEVGGGIEKDAIHEIKKDGRKVGEFPYITHDSVVSHVRGALVRHGVMLQPTVADRAQNTNRTELTVDVSFINIDKPEDRFTVRSIGYGVDSSDKGPGKAWSYAVKYALLKIFMLNSADDIEGDDKEHEKGATQDDVERAKGQADRADADAVEALRMALKVIQENGTLEDLDNWEGDPRNVALIARLPKKTRDWFKAQAESVASKLKERE